MKKVEEVLAITALKKLLKQRHLIKEEKNIYLGIMFKPYSKGSEFKSYSKGSDFFLYLTRNGLEVIEGGTSYKGSLLVTPSLTQLVINYKLEHQELKEILEKLEGVTQ